jgi:hypothetical protein
MGNGTGDRRHGRLMPTDAGRNEVRTGLFDLLGEPDRLVLSKTTLDQLQSRNSVRNNGIAYRGADRPHDREGKARTIFQRSAPLVRSMVGARREKLTDEVALRAHDLDAVISSLDRELCGRRVVTDRLLDLLGTQLGRNIAINRRLDGGRRDNRGVISVSPGVQDLQQNAATCSADGLGDLPVVRDLVRPLERARLVLHAACEIRSKPAGYDQARPSLGALGVEAAKFVETLWMTLKAGVHRSHDNAARQLHGANPDRIEQDRLSVRHGELRPWILKLGKPIGIICQYVYIFSMNGSRCPKHPSGINRTSAPACENYE